MKEKIIWLLKIINPSTDYTLTIYENGLVYGKDYNELEAKCLICANSVECSTKKIN